VRHAGQGVAHAARDSEVEAWLRRQLDGLNIPGVFADAIQHHSQPEPNGSTAAADCRLNYVVETLRQHPGFTPAVATLLDLIVNGGPERRGMALGHIGIWAKVWDQESDREVSEGSGAKYVVQRRPSDYRWWWPDREDDAVEGTMA
jgi:hypothetical protein